MRKLYKGEELLIEYNNSDSARVVRHFENASNFEGYAVFKEYINDNHILIEGLSIALNTEIVLALDNTDTMDYIIKQ